MKGIVIMKSNSKLSTLKSAIKCIWDIDRKHFAFGLVFVCLCAMDPLYNILPMKFVLDFLTEENFSLLKCVIFFAILLLVAITTNIFAQWYKNSYLPKFNIEIQQHIREKIFKKVYQTGYDNFDKPVFYNEYKMALNQMDSGITNISSSLFGFLSQILSIIIVGSIVLVTDPVLVCLVIVQVVTTVVLNIKQGTINYTYDAENIPNERKKQYVSRLFYLQDFIKDLKTSEFLSVIFSWQNKCYDKSKQIVDKYSFKKSILSFTINATSMIAKIGVYLYLAWSIHSGQNSLGDFAAMIASTVSLTTLITSLVSIIPNLDKQCRYLKKLFDFIEPINNEDVIQKLDFNYQLVFDKVNFAYPNSKITVLKNISLTIKAGQKIAIVGQNGAGKSTLISLILGLYKPTSGSIYIDSYKYNNSSTPMAITNAGVILQDSKTYAFSIAENVLLKPVRSNDEVALIHDALKYAGLDKQVSSLPNGISTPLSTEFDPSGTNFSGGEIQKLALARVYAGGKKLWVFDEPSSNLDPLAEYEFYKKMYNAPKEITVIFISHKMSMAAHADKIFFMKEGEITEVGTHNELMELKGNYYEYYTTQKRNEL